MGCCFQLIKKVQKKKKKKKKKKKNRNSNRIAQMLEDNVFYCNTGGRTKRKLPVEIKNSVNFQKYFAKTLAALLLYLTQPTSAFSKANCLRTLAI